MKKFFLIVFIGLVIPRASFCVDNSEPIGHPVDFYDTVQFRAAIINQDGDTIDVIGGGGVTASQLVDSILAFQNKVDSFKFTTTLTTYPTSKGAFFWNDTTKTIEIVNGDGSRTALGQENNVPVHNVSGVDIFNGDPVYYIASGSDEKRVGLASNLDAFTALPCIGLATTDIPHGNWGRICTFGDVHDLNTSAFDENGNVYLGDGEITPIKPTTGYEIVIGRCSQKHLSKGIISVYRVKNSFFSDLEVLGRFGTSGTYFDTLGITTPKIETDSISDGTDIYNIKVLIDNELQYGRNISGFMKKLNDANLEMVCAKDTLTMILITDSYGNIPWFDSVGNYIESVYRNVTIEATCYNYGGQSWKDMWPQIGDIIQQNPDLLVLGEYEGNGTEYQYLTLLEELVQKCLERTSSSIMITTWGSARNEVDAVVANPDTIGYLFFDKILNFYRQMSVYGIEVCDMNKAIYDWARDGGDLDNIYADAIHLNETGVYTIFYSEMIKHFRTPAWNENINASICNQEREKMLYFSNELRNDFFNTDKITFSDTSNWDLYNNLVMTTVQDTIIIEIDNAIGFELRYLNNQGRVKIEVSDDNGSTYKLPSEITYNGLPLAYFTPGYTGGISVISKHLTLKKNILPNGVFTSPYYYLMWVTGVTVDTVTLYYNGSPLGTYVHKLTEFDNGDINIPLSYNGELNYNSYDPAYHYANTVYAKSNWIDTVNMNIHNNARVYGFKRGNYKVRLSVLSDTARILGLNVLHGTDMNPDITDHIEVKSLSIKYNFDTIRNDTTINMSSETAKHLYKNKNSVLTINDAPFGNKAMIMIDHLNDSVLTISGATKYGTDNIYNIGDSKDLIEAFKWKENGTIYYTVTNIYKGYVGTYSNNEWADSIMIDYFDVRHAYDTLTYYAGDTAKTNAVQALKTWLEGSYAQSTFGRDGSNEDSADFFIMSRHTGTMTSNSWINTGNTLRWDIEGSVYSQNNIPAHTVTDKGFAIVSSTDYFQGVSLMNYINTGVIGAYYFNFRADSIAYLLFGSDDINRLMFTQNGNYIGEVQGTATKIDSLDFGNLTIYSRILINNCGVYQNAIRTPSNYTTSVFQIRYDGNSLDETSIDGVLVGVDNYFTDGGANDPIKDLLLEVDGGTNSTPGSTGTTAKSSIETKYTNNGWTATINTN